LSDLRDPEFAQSDRDEESSLYAQAFVLGLIPDQILSPIDGVCTRRTRPAVRRRCRASRSPTRTSSVGSARCSRAQRQLHDLPAPLELPGDRAKLAGSEEGGGTIEFELSERLSSRLKALARDRETTLFTVLMAAFQVLLSRHSGRIEILIGTLASGRASSEFRSTLGDFMNPIVVRGNLASNPSFSDFLRDMTQTVVDAVAHEAYPFVSLVQSLGVVRDHGRSPVFQTMFVLQEPQRSMDLAGLLTPGAGGMTNFGGLRAEPYSFRQQEGQLDITLEMNDVGRTLVANLKYKTERFERSTIEQMRAHFETLLEGVVENPHRRVSEIPLLTAEEQSRILREWNGTAAVYPAELGLDALFEAQVRRTPDRVAVLQAGREVTMPC